MAFPTSGYNPQTVHYLISSSAGVQLSIDGSVAESPTEAEELLSYLDTALAGFKTAYDGGTSYTVAVTKSFGGSTTPAAV